MKRIGILLCVVIAGCSSPRHQMDRQRISVDFTFQTDTHTLRGTLVKPPGTGPFPVVVWCHGSGELDRTAGLRVADPFLDEGIAFLAWDKIGTGESSGDFYAQPFSERVDVVLAAIRELEKRPDIDRFRIGLAGISQAGYVAPGVIRRYPSIDFLLLISPGIWTPEQERSYQEKTRFLEYLLRKVGVTDETQVSQILKHRSTIGELKDAGQRQALYEQIITTEWFPKVQFLFPDPQERSPAADRFNAEWLAFEPVKEYSAIQCRTLVLFGEADRCVDPEISGRNIRKGFSISGNENLTIHIYPGADHGLQIDGGYPESFWKDLKNWLRHDS